MADLSTTTGLADIASWASEDEKRLAEMFLNIGQGHVFAGWKSGEHAEKKHAFFEQVRALEHNYPGGVRKYCENARELLRASAAGENPFDGMKPEMPEGKSLDYGSDSFVSSEERGLAVFSKCAFVLVAGGLGERLGYTDIKISLPVQVTTDMTYLELYVQQILAMQRHSGSLRPETASAVPLAIMTSDDTHSRTVAMLEANGNFGMEAGQITIMKQEKVAALTDNEAHIAMEEGDPYVIETKPHGHGDVHTLLASTGLAAKWAAEGREYVVFFQDTNALCFTVTIAAIGVSEELGFEVNSVTVPRKAKDAVGAITRLVRADGSSITVNVEYNQLEPMLKASGFPDGDVNGPDGFSPFPGNINQLVLKLKPYAAVLARTGGLVPEFVNPKYADASKTKFKKATRLECMMQEHPKVLGPESRVGYTNFPDWTYSPVKNAVEDALAKARAGVPGRSAAEGELEFYAAECRRLSAVGVALPEPGVFRVLGFELPAPPRVVFHPNFAVSFAAFRSKFPAPAEVKISQRSTLVASGPGSVVVHSLDLDGALVIRAAAGASVTIRRLSVRNRGYELVPLAEGEAASDPVKIRGFKCVKHEARELTFDAPGEYVVDEA